MIYPLTITRVIERPLVVGALKGLAVVLSV
jgi:hypothetical protein